VNISRHPQQRRRPGLDIATRIFHDNHMVSQRASCLLQLHLLLFRRYGQTDKQTQFAPLQSALALTPPFYALACSLIPSSRSCVLMPLFKSCTGGSCQKRPSCVVYSRAEFSFFLSSFLSSTFPAPAAGLTRLK
jgi:hypothetical protein